MVIRGFGGFPPLQGVPDPPASRGGFGGTLPPILGRKDFGSPGEAGEKGGSGRGCDCELVQAAVADHNETFGAGQGHSQEGLSPEPTQSNKVRLRKGLGNSNFGLFDNGKKTAVLTTIFAIYGCQVVPSCNLLIPGGHQVVAR